MHTLILCVISLVLLITAVPGYGIAVPKAEDQQLNERWLLKDITIPAVNLSKVVEDISKTGKSVGGIIQDSLEAAVEEASDLWEETSSFRELLQQYGNTLLDDASAKFPEILTELNQYKDSINTIVEQTVKFESEVAAMAIKEMRTIDWKAFSDELDEMFLLVLSEIKADADRAPGHKERQDMVRLVLGKVEGWLVEVGVKYGIDREVLRSHLQALHMEMLVVLIGDLIEQHPRLFSTVVTAAVFMIIPESWLLRPSLSVFGFGPSGPIKGSIAAWAQSNIFGAVIEQGSWFSLLQKAGMTV